MDDITALVAKEVAKQLTKDVYDDAAKPLVKELGQALGTLGGLVGNVLLYPAKALNYKFKLKFESLAQEVKTKCESIPGDQRVEPSIQNVYPVLESLKYSIDIEEIRSMYINLLMASIDKRKVERIHPSYKTIINELSTTDVYVLDKLIKDPTNQTPVASIKFQFNKSIYKDYMPQIYIMNIHNDIHSPWKISISIQNLARLGLLNYLDRTISSYDYSIFKDDAFVNRMLNQCGIAHKKSINRDHKLNIHVQGQVVNLSDYGKGFSQTCLSE